GLNRRRLGLAKDDAIVLHPGPINRGIEIDSDVADGPFSLILNQVENGVAVRMAGLYLLAGGGERHRTPIVNRAERGPGVKIEDFLREQGTGADETPSPA